MSTIPVSLPEEDIQKFEEGMAKCASCGNWHDMEGLEPLVEYDCQYCDSQVFCPMSISGFWMYAQIGEGGMGRVYLAQERDNSTVYAMKLSEYTDECDFRFQSLLYEGEIVEELIHPNIVRTYRFGYKAGKAFLLMDYIQGITLDNCVINYALTEQRIVGWMTKLCNALSYLDDLSVLFRDLKPQNIIVDIDKLTLLDFGLAVHKDYRNDIDEENLVGSPSYIPPERVEGEVEDIRSDIYAMGMLFYFVASGKNYFEGAPEEIINGHMNDHRTPCRELLPGRSMEFNKILDRMISRDPHKRYQSYDEMRIELEALEQSLLPVY